MKDHETEYIKELYKIMIDKEDVPNVKKLIKGHPFDLVRKYFITKTSIYSSEFIFNNKSFYKMYESYFYNSYIYIETVKDYSYKKCLNKLIKIFSKKYILENHDKFIEWMERRYRTSVFNRDHYFFLLNLYNDQFKKRLTDEIRYIRFNFYILEGGLTDEQNKQIKLKYKFIDYDMDEEDYNEDGTEAKTTERTENNIKFI